MKYEKKYYFLNTILFIFVLCVSIVLYARYLGVKGLIVKEYKVESNILTSNFSGIKIVHFSDLLYKSTVDSDDVKVLINKINILKPDIVVFSGDIININSKIVEEDKEFLIENLSKIDASIGKYAVYGDYDYSYDDYEEVMRKSDFIILNNSFDTIYYKDNNPLYIVGLPSSLKDTIDINSSFSFYNEEDRRYTIVLTHEGANIKYINESTYEVDLILGGHSLNGSVVVPYYGPLFVDEASYKYFAPYYNKGITDIYISSGIGTNEYAFRFNNKPSFNFYRLKAQ
ncbi:MAG: hypothetical protein GX758_00775 [Tenericutes bacterium]|nr:hypothetical protein [Mycoplasmatota bacterium]